MKFWRNFLNFLEDLFKQLEKRIANVEHNMTILCENIELQCAFEANEDPLHSVSDIPAKLLPENENRQAIIIQNIGLHPCYIHLGEGISINCFHSILAADTLEKQGNGGSIELKNWHGSIYAICEKETKVSVMEY